VVAGLPRPGAICCLEGSAAADWIVDYVREQR